MLHKMVLHRSKELHKRILRKEKYQMLQDIMNLYKGTNEVAPIAKGIQSMNTSSSMLDCNCVDANCTNCN